MEVTTKQKILFDPSNLETEYLELRRTLYTKLFIYIMITNGGIMLIELLRALFYSQTRSLFTFSVMLIFTTVLSKTVLQIKEKQEMAITIFIGVFYLSGLVANYHGQAGYFDNPVDAWYFGYALAMFDRLVAGRIPTSFYRTTFSIMMTFIRFVVIPPKDQGIAMIHFLYLIFGIYLDIDKENHDKNLFQKYFSYKNQLGKFKDLVVNDIPEAITILTQDLTKCLFMNNSFQSLIGTSSTESNIINQLNQFKVQDEPSCESVDSLMSISSLNQSLYSFLETKVLDAEDFFANQQVSCNLTYTPLNGNQQDQHNQSESHIFEAKIFHIIWDGQSAVAVLLHDVTQQNIIMALKSADEQKDRLLATVSHELRTPLNGMLGMIQIIQKQVQDPMLSRYVSICRTSGHLLMGLVNSILDLNQIRAKKLKLNLEKVNIYELLAEVVSLFELQCAQKGINLELRIHPSTPKFIITDNNRLGQIFINLVGNAVKFTIKGGIIVTAREADGTHIELSVEDTGIGIKNEDQGKLFKMFGRIEKKSSAPQQQGIGLGLTISDSLARILCSNDKIGGIRVQSTEGEGSRFSFLINIKLEEPQLSRTLTRLSDFPVNLTDEFGDVNNKMLNYMSVKSVRKRSYLSRRIEQPFIERSRTIDVHNLSTLSGSTFARTLQPDFSFQSEIRGSSRPIRLMNTFYILIVDDNPFNITVAEHMILAQGYKVKTALHGEIAIDILTNNDYSVEPIKLILMDCQMPVMNGYETTRILRKMMQQKQIPEIPIVALTANNSEADKEACIKAGMSGHLTKPLKETDLLKILSQFVWNKT